MSKHTQGPWVVRRGEICYTSKEDDQSFGMLCPVDLCDEDNMRLIAAAPELLEAVQYMIEWDDREKDHAVSFEQRMALCEAAFEKARAAIAKATT